MSGEWEEYRHAVEEQRREDYATFGGKPPLSVRFIRSLFSLLIIFSVPVLLALLIASVTPKPKSNDEKLDEIREEIGTAGIIDYVSDQWDDWEIWVYLFGETYMSPVTVEDDYVDGYFSGYDKGYSDGYSDALDSIK